MFHKMTFICIILAIITFTLSGPGSKTAAQGAGGLDAAIVGSAKVVTDTKAIIQISIQNSEFISEY